MFMTLLYLGLFLWVATHWLKRLMPDMRAGMDVRFGAGPARGVIAGLIGVSLVLIIIGYRGAPANPLYTPFANAGHVNNLIMVLAVICLGMGSSKGRMRTWLRHPMLTGVILWAAAHLLVNGDMASVVLFGTLGAWALFSIALINRAEGPWQRPDPGPISGDIKLLIISAVILAALATIHILLGYNPFLGTYA